MDEDNPTMPPQTIPTDSADSDVKQWVKGLGNATKGSVPSDDEFNKNLKSHEGSYTKILEAYEDDIRNTLSKKASYKPKVFWFSFLALIAVSALVLILTIVLIIAAFLNDGYFLWGITAIEVLFTFLATFIIIPEVITKYLFNTEEEKYMSEIIKSIQVYDRARSQTKRTADLENED